MKYDKMQNEPNKFPKIKSVELTPILGPLAAKF